MYAGSYDFTKRTFLNKILRDGAYKTSLMSGLNIILQQIVEMGSLSLFNCGVRYLLCVIFSANMLGLSLDK